MSQIPNNHVSVLEIDTKAIQHNITYFKNKLKPETKVLAVVKAYSYGHDSVEISKYLESQNLVDYLAVAFSEEGVALRNNGVTLPILVLHPQIVNFEALIDHQLEPNIHSKKGLNAFLKLISIKKIQQYPIHLKFNTGLNRLGFLKEDIPFILESLEKSPLKIESIFSHLAASEDLNEKEFTLGQISEFDSIVAEFEKTLTYKPMLHLANTSGIINYSNAHFDMVRLGIGMYGFGNDPYETSQLKNAGTLKTIISQIHHIKIGDSLGYNRAYIAKKNTRSATLPIGHADGISRNLGQGKGHVKINNQLCPIIGNVCMDMIMVDVTDVDCKEGDSVIIFDSQDMVNELALQSDTINYEIITSISQRIARKIIF